MARVGSDGAERDAGSPDETMEEIGRLRSYVTSARSRAGDAAGSMLSRIEGRRDAVPMLDVAMRLVDRDRVAVGSVLGSAVAFRLFLFFVPVMLFFMGVVNLIIGDVDAEQVSEETGLGGSVANQIAQSLSSGAVTKWVAILLGLWGALWAGRSLAKVLMAVAILSWGIESPRRSPSIKIVMAVVGLLAALVVSMAVINRIRMSLGPAIGATSILAGAALYAASWFFVSLALPRATRDPSALLPGAALVGVILGGLQWFTQFYAPSQISHSSAVYGTFGVAVVALGWFFILGRTLVLATSVNAVIWERFGSIAGFVFGLPLIRAIPRRFPAVARFFDLGKDPAPAESDEGDDLPSG